MKSIVFIWYLKYSDNVKSCLIKNNIINEADFSSTRAFENTLNAKVFDIIRYLLPSSVATSLGASFSTRILESHLCFMLSHPLEEVRLVAKNMHEEALKVSPGLLKHVGINDYEEKRRKKLDEFVGEMLRITMQEGDEGLYTGIQNKDRVSIIFEGDLDNHILASIIFESGREEGISYDESLEIVEDLSNDDKRTLMHLAMVDRGDFDRMPRSFQHSSVLVEFLVDFGAYRDLQRHRASNQLWQGATSIHGYDYPEYIDLPGMEEFKEVYDNVMTKSTILGKKVIKENSYLSEYVCALGHLIRTSFEMDPGQLAYVIELRTTPQGHHSYRNLFIELHRQIKEFAPIFSKYIKVGNSLNSSRKSQEEKAEKKRKNLGI